MSGDLRAAVEGLKATPVASEYVAWNKAVDEVLALIPEGAVLVTEETLATSIRYVEQTRTDALGIVGPAYNGPPPEWYDEYAAAILRHLREGTE